jgi:hypothetical protein
MLPNAPTATDAKAPLTRENVGAPGRIRTCGLLLRRQTLYPLSYGGGYWVTAPMGVHRLAYRRPY